jgi:hypothetical protein
MSVMGLLMKYLKIKKMKRSRYDYLRKPNLNSVPDGFVKYLDTALYVSENGQVWDSLIEGFVIGRPNNGYTMFSFKRRGKKVKVGLHRFLATCFIPNPQKCRLVRHLNDIKSDNRLINLAWGNDLENVRDAFRNGKMQHRNHPKGSKCGRAKLNELSVLETRKLHADGEKIKDLAVKYSVSNGSIERVVNKTRWTHI